MTKTRCECIKLLPILREYPPVYSSHHQLGYRIYGRSSPWFPGPVPQLHLSSGGHAEAYFLAKVPYLPPGRACRQTPMTDDNDTWPKMRPADPLMTMTDRVCRIGTVRGNLDSTQSVGESLRIPSREASLSPHGPPPHWPLDQSFARTSSRRSIRARRRPTRPDQNLLKSGNFGSVLCAHHGVLWSCSR